MKKAISMFLAGTVALGAVSCKKDTNKPEPAPQGKTAMSVVAYEGNGLRAAAESQDDAAGVGAESKVANGMFITISETNEPTFSPLTAATPLTAPNEAMFQSAVFEYNGPTGKVNSRLILNTNEVAADLHKKFAAAGDEMVTIDQLSKLTKESGFTMTSKSTKEVTIHPNVKASEVEAKNNVFSFDVERVVSKVQVTEISAGMNIEEVVKKYPGASFTDLKYSVAGSAKKAYLFGDKAGERTMTASSGNAYKTYKDFTSAIHTLAAGSADRKDQLTKVSDANNNVVAQNSSADFTKHSLAIAKATDDNDRKKSTENGIYFLENSLQLGVTDFNQLMYNDIVYVKVYAKLTFANDDSTTPVMKLDGQNLVAATGAEVNAHQEGTFFQGQDGVLYLTGDAAEKAGNAEYKQFSKGVMYWRFPANNVIDGGLTKYADTRRNNIYSILLEKITNLGDNYDPIDPNDPNIPGPGVDGTPDNPKEPQKPDQDPVNPAKTNVQVKATVLMWNVVSRGVELN